MDCYHHLKKNARVVKKKIRLAQAAFIFLKHIAYFHCHTAHIAAWSGSFSLQPKLQQFLSSCLSPHASMPFAPCSGTLGHPNIL